MKNPNLARRDNLEMVSGGQENPTTEGPELAVIIPTLNVRDNIRPLVDLLDTALDSVSWVAIFVDDDSPDGAAEQIREISRRDRRVRCLQRIGRRGLTSGLHRRRIGSFGTLHRRYRCGHGARREIVAGNAGDLEKRSRGPVANSMRSSLGNR